MINKLCLALVGKNVYSQIYRNFSKRKGLEQNIKQQTKKKISNSSKTSNLQPLQSENLIQLSSMQYISIQFYPLSIFITPTILNLTSMSDPYFLLGTILCQKYASIALFMNLDFGGDKNKIFLYLTIMASVHTLTGYYSILTPLAMALFSIVSPFKFNQNRQKYTEIQANRLKVMSSIRVVYFCIFIFAATLKAMYYQEVFKIQKSLDKLNQQNLAAKQSI